MALGLGDPATYRRREVPEVDRFDGPIASILTGNLASLQATKIARRFGLAPAVAATVAALAFDGGVR